MPAHWDYDFCPIERAKRRSEEADVYVGSVTLEPKGDIRFGETRAKLGERIAVRTDEYAISRVWPKLCCH